MRGTKKQTTVLISGASLAGPALAFWLVRYGYKVTIVELAPALPDGGNRVDVRGVALEVLERMGISEAARSMDFKTEGTDYVDGSGKVIAQMNDAALGNHSGVDIEILRGDLAHLLFGLTKGSVEYIWGDTITNITQAEDEVAVEFAHAAPRKFDLVIGADGIHSNTRKLAFGVQESAVSHYLGCYIAIATIPNYLGLDATQRMYTVPGKTVGVFAAGGKPVTQVMFAFRSPQLEYNRNDTEYKKALLGLAYQDVAGWETQRLINYAMQSQDFYFDSMTQIKMQVYHRDRVALVGDAAYSPSPASGQGSSMALTGAYVLAGELYRAKGDFRKAFAEYERKMLPYVEGCQAIGATGANSLVEASKFKIGLRNFFIKRPILLKGMYKKIQAQIDEASHKLTIEDY